MNTVFYYFSELKVRILRLIKHLLSPFSSRIRNDFHYSSIREWSGDLFCYMVDVLAIGEIYQLIIRVFKWNIRKLTEDEKALIFDIFGDSIDYNLIMIDDNAKLGTKKLALAYVSFNTINYRNQIQKDTLVHEAMHIWQFQNFGSIYLNRAIKAQRSVEGYYYGGEQGLYIAMTKGKPLTSFNFEQQADIIEDYYKVKNNLRTVSKMSYVVYEYYAQQLKIDTQI